MTTAVRRTDSAGGIQGGDALLHPITLAALALLVINDHILKSTWPGPVTGKLSDVAGMVFLPVFLVSAWEIALNLGGRWTGPRLRALLVAGIASAATLTLIKTLPLAAQVAGDLLGIAQWVLAVPIGLISGQPLPPVVSARVTVDPTDLLALPAIALALWAGAGRVRRTRSLGHAASDLWLA